MKAKTVKIRCTGEELREAMQASREREAAVLFFLLGAERENVMFQGRTAAEALAAASYLLRISPEEIAKLREEML